MRGRVDLWQNLKKKRITDHDFPPPLKMWGRKIKKWKGTKLTINEQLQINYKVLRDKQNRLFFNYWPIRKQAWRRYVFV